MLVDESKVFTGLTIEFPTLVCAMLNSDGGLIRFQDNEIDQLIANIKNFINDKVRPNASECLRFLVNFDYNKTFLNLRIKPLEDAVAEVSTRKGYKAYVVDKGVTKELNATERNQLLAQKKGLDDPLKNRRGLIENPSYKCLKLLLPPEYQDLSPMEFAQFFDLVDSSLRPNRNSDLLSDQNPYPFYFYRYKGKSLSSDFSRTNYGNRPLAMAYQAMAMRIEAELMSLMDFSTQNLDINALLAILGSLICTNDWTFDAPSVAIFDNRVEFRSYIRDVVGNVASSKGQAMPSNRTLTKTLRNLGIIQGLESSPSWAFGNPQVSRRKDGNMLITVYHFPYTYQEVREHKAKRLSLPLTDTEGRVLSLLREDPSLRAEDISYMLTRSKKTVERSFVSLQRKGYLTRLGSKRYGRWSLTRPEQI